MEEKNWTWQRLGGQARGELDRRSFQPGRYLDGREKVVAGPEAGSLIDEGASAGTGMCPCSTSIILTYFHGNWRPTAAFHRRTARLFHPSRFRFHLLGDACGRGLGTAQLVLCACKLAAGVFVRPSRANAAATLHTGPEAHALDGTDGAWDGHESRDVASHTHDSPARHAKQLES
ncbi:hypothetical protein MAPG_07312 [Magnaporthiopsis poae ATCC 64411]|uniref:Uncharacterized protein n=1 Tax=Magnaporthiopsis poae (strain ATCC 64411 / 73-15) TaxID=644358 RepID=A0A0C4E4C0_MAGP6|nr:hypothetical protein MAPG_07312 [Magnaporthiopsis poae ATCC 64411]